MSNEKCRLCLKVNPPGSRFCKFCGNDLSFSIQADGLLPAGAILRGCYVIEDVIGEGGMGVVYRCHHNILGTRYALKVLNANLARVELLRQRFLAEAKIQATVRHPHIVHVLDVIDGQKDGGIPGVLAIVMEYIEGESLDQMLEQGPLSEHDAVSCALVILDAIGFAHHSGIVHRDLKPQNIMIRHTGAQEALYEGVKVMDFGIAKLLQQEDQRTATGQQMGTPRYMAPEQIENARNVDERTDLYAIGLTLYELLCGRTPFEEFKEFELMKAQLSMKPPSLRKFRAGISERLEAIVMKSLEKDRANRYPNAETFQRALLSLGGYDDIPLQLNPYEGTSLISTNQKLQDKIERTIARSGRSADKLKKVPSKLDNEKISRVQARITRESEAVNERDDLLEKKLAIELERARKNAGKVSAEQPSLVKEAPDSAAKKAKKENAKERIKSTGRQESKENTGAGKRRRSILNISKEKQSQPGSSSSHSFKRVRSSVRALLAGKTKASGNANDAENQAARKPDASTPQVKQEQALEAAKDKGTREAAKDKGTREAAKDKGTREAAKDKGAREAAKDKGTREAAKDKGTREAAKDKGTREAAKDKNIREAAKDKGTRESAKDKNTREAAKDKGALDNQKEKDVSLKDSEKKSARVGAVKRDAVAKAEPAEKQVAAPAKADLKRKSHSSVKIFIAIMLLLIAGGLIYRHTHQLPVQSAPEETAAVETVQADFAWKEVSSNAGRMTVVPAGLHWVSTGKKDELHQVKLSAFAIDQVEVSYYEYGKCIEAGKCAPLKRAVEDLNLPVTGIGFGSAEAFCKYAGKSLPSAEQWEAAARFGGETNGITHVNVACDTVNFGSGPRGECRGNTGAENVFYRVQGGNPGHILNMLGNVREWTTTADRKDRQKHQTKGGSYKSAREEISIGAALSVGINSGADDVGFRCIREM